MNKKLTLPLRESPAQVLTPLDLPARKLVRQMRADGATLRRRAGQHDHFYYRLGPEGTWELNLAFSMLVVPTIYRLSGWKPAGTDPRLRCEGLLPVAP